MLYNPNLPDEWPQTEATLVPHGDPIEIDGRTGVISSRIIEIDGNRVLQILHCWQTILGEAKIESTSHSAHLIGVKIDGEYASVRVQMYQSVDNARLIFASQVISHFQQKV